MRSNKFILYFILACLTCQMMFLSGCRRTSQVFLFSDSAKIKKIEEMQERGSEIRNQSNFELAIAIHDSCIKMAEDIHDTMQLIIALNNQGTNYRRLSAMKEASDYHYRALELCDAYSDTTSHKAKKNRVRSLNGLGNLLSSLGNEEAALSMLRRALHGEEQLGSPTGQAINLANIGSIKRNMGERDSARYYFNLSMQKNREDNNIVGISLCYSYIGDLEHASGHKTEAMNNYRQAYIVGRSTNDTWHWLTPCISLASILVDNNETDSASKYINLGVEAAKQIHSNEHLSKLYRLRSRLEDQQGHALSALNDLKLSIALNDSINSEESSNHIQNARVNYEASRRTIEVQQAEERASMSRMVRNIAITAAILVLIFVGIAAWVTRRASRARRKAIKEREIFYRNVTHQLRTPMTVVMGMVDQLEDHIPTGDVIGKESLKAAQRQSRNLLELIKQLINAAKEGTMVEMSDVDVARIQGAPIITPAGGEASGHSSVNNALSKINKTPFIKPELQESLTNPSTILVAEDNDDVAMMICTLLRDNGYYVTRAADGQEALDMLQDELPDLLLTDIAMPRMDGLELMRHVREDDTMCHLPIIVASARVEDSERLEGISAGAEVYLTKPFIPEELLLRVKKILEQRERLRRSFTHASADSETESAAPMMISAHEHEYIIDINRHIDENMLSGDVNTAFLADKMCTSVGTLNRKIKNITGMSATLYIRNRRIIKAKELLKKTDKPIGDIEVICGFNTPGHFSRLFKSETGMSPSEYRQKAQ